MGSSMVKQERTGWRDENLSRFHRLLGYNCPMVDIDFLVAEYDNKKVVAVIEYKNEHADPRTISAETNTSLKATADFCTDAGRPMFIVVYSDDFNTWTIYPINDLAVETLNGKKQSYQLTRKQFIYGFLYKTLRARIPDSLDAKDIQEALDFVPEHN